MNEPLLRQALDALELQRTGLQWYRDEHPESVDGSDSDCDAEVVEVITALERYLTTPKLTHDMKEGELRMHWGEIDGSPDIIYSWQGDISMKRDSRMLHNFLGSRSPNPHKQPIFGDMKPSFLEELEARGYDLSTIKFSIMKKTEEVGAAIAAMEAELAKLVEPIDQGYMQSIADNVSTRIDKPEPICTPRHLNIAFHTKCACDQLTRYGGGVACVELLDILETLADINDDLQHGRDKSVVHQQISKAKSLLNRLAIVTELKVPDTSCNSPTDAPHGP